MSTTPTSRRRSGSDEDKERLLREDVDPLIPVPDERRPPAVERPSPAGSGRHWLAPLAVAATVAVVAGGIGVVALQHRTTVPASGTQITNPIPAPHVTAASAQPTPARTRVPTSTAAPAGQVVTAAGATLTIPAGYTFRKDTGSAGSTPISERWCLDTTGTSNCVISFSRLEPKANQLSADTEGDYLSNPQYCSPTKPFTAKLTSYHDTTFGSRAAEFRSWHWACSAGLSFDVAQYSVMTPTPFDLFSDKASPAVTSVMAEVVASAQLPPATGTIRYYDHGFVTAATPQADGSTMLLIDRVAVGWPNQSTATYSYRVPAGVTFLGTVAPVDATGLRGRTVSVFTDGSVVTLGLIASS